jgi:RNA polymerase sigma-54 factor
VDGWEASYSASDHEWGTLPSSSGRDAGQDKIEAMNNAPGEGPTLAETLLRQFDALPGAARLRPLAEQILFNLDEREWLRVPLEDACALLADRFDREDAEQALRMIQSLEPKGIGARTMSECLVLQLEPSDPRYERKRLLTDHY